MIHLLLLLTANPIKTTGPEAMRQQSLGITKRAMFSRGAAAIRGKTLIVNLPGSPKGVQENLSFIIAELYHGLDILTGRGGECAG